MSSVEEPAARAARVDTALQRARKAWLLWDARREQGWRVPGEPPPEALVPPELEQEARAVVLALVEAYRTAGPAGREALRAGVAGLGDVLRALQGFLFEAAEEVAATREAAWVERCCAAAALVGEAVDPRDRQVGVERLYQAASVAGLNAEAITGRLRDPGARARYA